MLHAVTADLRHIVRDEGVDAEIIGGRTVEQLEMLGDDAFRLFGKAIDIGGRVLAVDRQADRIGLAVRLQRPCPQREVGKFGRAVHQILEVGRPERARTSRDRRQLGHDLPALIARVEDDADRTIVIAARPHHRGGHVEVRMGRIDLRIGAVATIAVQRVADGHGAAMLGHGPAIGIGAHDRERLARGVGGGDRIDVLRKFVERVASRGGARHPEFDRAGFQRAIGDRDASLVMDRIVEAEVVADRGIAARIARLGGGGRGCCQ